MAEMKAKELVITLGKIHKSTAEFRACKVADKRVADLISDCSSLGLDQHINTLIDIKDDINGLYIEAAKSEVARIKGELQ